MPVFLHLESTLNQDESTQRKLSAEFKISGETNYRKASTSQIWNQAARLASGFKFQRASHKATSQRGKRASTLSRNECFLRSWGSLSSSRRLWSALSWVWMRWGSWSGKCWASEGCTCVCVPIWSHGTRKIFFVSWSLGLLFENRLNVARKAWLTCAVRSTRGIVS